MESTYGDRLHDGEEPDYVGQLAEIIQDTFKRGGNVGGAVFCCRKDTGDALFYKADQRAGTDYGKSGF